MGWVGWVGQLGEMQIMRALLVLGRLWVVLALVGATSRCVGIARLLVAQQIAEVVCT